MNGQQRPLVLVSFCAVLVVLAVWGAVGGLSSRLFGDIDGLLLLAVSLMIAVIFAPMLYLLGKEQGWFARRRKVSDPQRGLEKGIDVPEQPLR
jgi:hypothetical protein